MADFVTEREEMVAEQIAARGIRNPRLLAAFRAVPREAFVADKYRPFAYGDGPLPIEAGQTISQPYIVALMIDEARIGPDDRVLEIGAGSGYAAAMLGNVASEVVSVERHSELVAIADRRIAGLGLRNVRIVHGDGSLGWPGEAPYDAILCAAAGHEVPDAWIAQLKPGGRIVMPVGEAGGVQTLVKIVKRADGSLEHHGLGDVRFVPLVAGAVRDEVSDSLVRTPAQTIAEDADPFDEIDEEEFTAWFDRFADARVVLLGEASHGTSEFYRARAAITRRLVDRHGFTIVALEADWPDAATLDRWVRHRPPREGEEAAFERFPTWMWRNAEFDGFVRWLREYNKGRPPDAMAGLFGLDLYNLSASMQAVIDYLDEVDPDAAAHARERYSCLAPFSHQPQAYGQLATHHGYAFCQDGAVAMLKDLLAKRLDYARADGEEWLDAAANARLVKNAEEYYRAMYQGSAESWNRRDSHMVETLCALLDARGPGSKAVVWAHNSHIGDARQTDMGWSREEHNIGQLARERFGEQARLVGFGTHGGTVAAADDWDAPMKVKRVNPSRPDSHERLCHDSGVDRFRLDLREGQSPGARRVLAETRLERFIGVIYRPDTERWSHYSEAVLARQFDAWVWFDETSAVTPLPGEARPGGASDETWPSGL